MCAARVCGAWARPYGFVLRGLGYGVGWPGGWAWRAGVAGADGTASCVTGSDGPAFDAAKLDVQSALAYHYRMPRPLWQPGKSANPAGRPKGIPNRTTRDVREMLVDALQMAGGARYLAAQAKANPVAFLALVGKTLPIKAEAGSSGTVIIVTGVERDLASYEGPSETLEGICVELGLPAPSEASEALPEALAGESDETV